MPSLLEALLLETIEILFLVASSILVQAYLEILLLLWLLPSLPT